MEFGIFQSKMHSFAGCTSILSWGGHSADGGMYIGRNMDWGPTFNEFAQVLTVLRPTDGSYKYASVGWPGMYCTFTALNEQGVYLDIHDGTSMGGSVVYEERPSSLNGLADLMAEAAQETVGSVNRAGGQAMSLTGDITNAGSARALVESAVATFGRLDCAFNNAGIAPWQVQAGGMKTAERWSIPVRSLVSSACRMGLVTWLQSTGSLA
jgi:hypothetical protein